MKKGILFFGMLWIFHSSSFAQIGLHHLVLFKLKPGVEKSDERFKKAVALLEELPREIPQIIDFRGGENFSERPVAYDYGLMVLLANEKSLQLYLDHPAHKAVAAAWKEIAEWNIADFWASAGRVQE
jgi:hypothetical protein